MIGISVILCAVLSGCFSREDNKRRNALFEEVDVFDPRFNTNEYPPELSGMLNQLDNFWVCSSRKWEVTEMPTVNDSDKRYLMRIQSLGDDMYERRHIHIPLDDSLSYDLFIIVCANNVDTKECADSVGETSARFPGILLGHSMKGEVVSIEFKPPSKNYDVIEIFSTAPVRDLVIEDRDGTIHLRKRVLYAIAIEDKKGHQNSAIKASCF